MVDATIQALTQQVATLTALVGQVAQLNQTTKQVNLQPFDGEAKEVAAFISAVEANYNANSWNDDRVPDDRLTNNVTYTPEQVYAKSYAQVNKIAGFLRKSAAIWWQNLPRKPLTWQEMVPVAAQAANNNQPGYPDIARQPGLRELLINKFRSSAHIAEAKKRLATARFNTDGTKTFEAFAAEIDADLIIIGMPYNDANYITCGVQADTLFKTLPQ